MLPRSARPVRWWEIVATFVAWGGLLAAGFAIATMLAVPLFWSTALTMVLGSALVGQLLLERWADHVDGHLDTAWRSKNVRRSRTARVVVKDAREANNRLWEFITIGTFWLAVAGATALGAAMAGEAAEAGLVCFEADRPFSAVLSSWQAEVRCGS